MAVKYSKISGVLRWSEGSMVLRKGMSIDDDHPLVTERPDLWDDKEPGANIPNRVQSTMQRPGEARHEQPPTIPAPPRAPKQ